MLQAPNLSGISRKTEGQVCVMSLDSAKCPGLHFRVSFKATEQQIELLQIDLYSSHAAAYAGNVAGLLGEDIESELNSTQQTLIWAHVHEFERQKDLKRSRLPRQSDEQNRDPAAAGWLA
jgi:hypothetical protein